MLRFWLRNSIVFEGVLPIFPCCLYVCRLKFQIQVYEFDKLE